MNYQQFNHRKFNIHYFQEIGSTNSHLLQKAQINQANEFDVIVSDIQTKGRGRKNRQWQSYKDNLHFSFLVKPTINIDKISQLSLLCAVALGKSLEEVFMQSNIKAKINYKWPNDLLIDGKKIAGILLESSISQSKCQFIAIGIGFNIAKNPQSSIFASTNLKALGLEVDKINFLKSFLEHFESLYQSWLNFGFENIKKIWLKKAFKLNQELELSIDDKKTKGIFIGLDELGNLLLDQKGQNIQTINYAEIL